ncbi:unnamed protein product [Schistosoma rodhaini]|uniref:Reverse transcriptase domain-containing protein n=1 Tax=Schistosoma rodhaini TaxID=6188 RepID=A0AA85FGV2_9TREM|nr:unnamed protein product [Schistosoma rodhaini]
MNKTDYIDKALEHLSTGHNKKIDRKTPQTIKNKVKSETSLLLKDLKPVTGVLLWFDLYSKSCNTARFYGLPKIHKPDIPLRPIVNFTNTPGCALSKYLSSILMPLQINLHNMITDS